MSLGVEQIQAVNATNDESGLGCERIESHGARRRRVNAAQVDGEFLVDENPKVVVAFEREDFAALVFELGM